MSRFLGKTTLAVVGKRRSTRRACSFPSVQAKAGRERCVSVPRPLLMPKWVRHTNHHRIHSPRSTWSVSSGSSRVAVSRRQGRTSSRCRRHCDVRRRRLSGEVKWFRYRFRRGERMGSTHRPSAPSTRHCLRDVESRSVAACGAEVPAARLKARGRGRRRTAFLVGAPGPSGILLVCSVTAPGARRPSKVSQSPGPRSSVRVGDGVSVQHLDDAVARETDSPPFGPDAARRGGSQLSSASTPLRTSSSGGPPPRQDARAR